MKFTDYFKEYAKPFLIFFVIILLLVAVTLTAVFFIPFGKSDEEIPKTVKLTLNGKEEKTSGNMVYFDGEAYLDFAKVASSFGMKLSGTSDTLIISTENGEKIEFTDGERQAVINGNKILLNEAVRLEDSVVILPVSFIETYVTGMTVDISEDLKTISVSRKVSSSGLFFSVQSQDVLSRVSADGVKVKMTIDESELNYEFIGDYSAVKKYLNPSNRDDYLVLCSPLSPMNDKFVPDNLTVITRLKKGSSYKYELVLCADKALTAMLSEMDAAGITGVNAVRGYVSYAELKKNYNSAIAKGNDAIAPGESDHLSGLGADITNAAKADVSFAETDAYKWLCENAYKFGFIERYPSDAESKTKMAAEPCHWRFVGQYHAAIMRREGLCLEEYIEKIQVK